MTKVQFWTKFCLEPGSGSSDDEAEDNSVFALRREEFELSPEEESLCTNVTAKLVNLQLKFPDIVWIRRKNMHFRSKRSKFLCRLKTGDYDVLGNGKSIKEAILDGLELLNYFLPNDDEDDGGFMLHFPVFGDYDKRDDCSFDKISVHSPIKIESVRDSEEQLGESGFVKKRDCFDTIELNDNFLDAGGEDVVDNKQVINENGSDQNFSFEITDAKDIDGFGGWNPLVFKPSPALSSSPIPQDTQDLHGIIDSDESSVCGSSVEFEPELHKLDSVDGTGDHHIEEQEKVTVSETFLKYMEPQILGVSLEYDENVPHIPVECCNKSKIIYGVPEAVPVEFELVRLRSGGLPTILECEQESMDDLPVEAVHPTDIYEAGVEELEIDNRQGVDGDNEVVGLEAIEPAQPPNPSKPDDATFDVLPSATPFVESSMDEVAEKVLDVNSDSTIPNSELNATPNDQPTEPGEPAQTADLRTADLDGVNTIVEVVDEELKESQGSLDVIALNTNTTLDEGVDGDNELVSAEAGEATPPTPTKASDATFDVLPSATPFVESSVDEAAEKVSDVNPAATPNDQLNGAVEPAQTADLRTADLDDVNTIVEVVEEELKDSQRISEVIALNTNITLGEGVDGNKEHFALEAGEPKSTSPAKPADATFDALPSMTLLMEPSVDEVVEKASDLNSAASSSDRSPELASASTLDSKTGELDGRNRIVEIALKDADLDPLRANTKPVEPEQPKQDEWQPETQTNRRGQSQSRTRKQWHQRGQGQGHHYNQFRGHGHRGGWYN